MLYYVILNYMMFCSVTSCEMVCWCDVIWWYDMIRCDVKWLCDLTWHYYFNCMTLINMSTIEWRHITYSMYHYLSANTSTGWWHSFTHRQQSRTCWGSETASRQRRRHRSQNKCKLHHHGTILRIVHNYIRHCVNTALQWSRHDTMIVRIIEVEVVVVAVVAVVAAAVVTMSIL